MKCNSKDDDRTWYCGIDLSGNPQYGYAVTFAELREASSYFRSGFIVETEEEAKAWAYEHAKALEQEE